MVANSTLNRYHRFRWCGGAIVLLALLLVVPSVLRAQPLRGRVLGPGNIPLAGVLVQVQQPDGQIAATTTTSESGFFAIASITDGSYNVRVLRIGYRAYIAGRVTIAGATTATLNIAWDAIPIPLATRLVTAPRTCKVSGDSGTLIANVWEETRKALLSSLVAEQELKNAPEVTRLNYQRMIDSAGIVRSQIVTRDKANTFRGYSSWDPDSLAVRGYVTSDFDETSFVGPDALTLLSPSFAGGHCYAIVADDVAHPRDVGLQFTPVEDKNRKRVDIRGTFWVDRASWNLRSVEFVYDVPSARLMYDLQSAKLIDLSWAQGGGLVEFGTLSTGEWMVTNWRIRMPTVATEHTTRGAASVSRVSMKPVLMDVQESGGMVTRVMRDTTTLYSARLPNTELRIISAEPGADAPSAEVSVRGSQFVGKSDESGVIGLPEMIEGKYFITARFPGMNALSDLVTEKVISVTKADGRDSVFVPTSRTWIRAACGEKSAGSRLPTMYGSVRNKDGRITGGIVTVRWETPAKSPKGKKSEATSYPEKHVRAALVNDSGNYVLCDVPRSGVSLRVESPAGVDQRFVRIAPEDALLELPLVVSAQAISNNDEGIAVPSVIEFLVIDQRNQPVKVKLDYENAFRERGTFQTDSLGRGLLLDQPTGPWTVQGKNGLVTEKIIVAGYNFIALRVTKR